MPNKPIGPLRQRIIDDMRAPHTGRGRRFDPCIAHHSSIARQHSQRGVRRGNDASRSFICDADHIPRDTLALAHSVRQRGLDPADEPMRKAPTRCRQRRDDWQLRFAGYANAD